MRVLRNLIAVTLVVGLAACESAVEPMAAPEQGQTQDPVLSAQPAQAASWGDVSTDAIPEPFNDEVSITLSDGALIKLVPDASGAFKVEGYNNSLVPPHGVVACGGPINRLSNDTCYTPGNMVPGVSLDNQLGVGDPTIGVVVTGSFFLGLPDEMAAANFFVDNTVITTRDDNGRGATTVSMEVHQPLFPCILTINYFDPRGPFLGSATVISGPGAPFKISASTLPPFRIGRVELTNLFGPCAELVNSTTVNRR